MWWSLCVEVSDCRIDLLWRKRTCRNGRDWHFGRQNIIVYISMGRNKHALARTGVLVKSLVWWILGRLLAKRDSPTLPGSLPNVDVDTTQYSLCVLRDAGFVNFLPIPWWDCVSPIRNGFVRRQPWHCQYQVIHPISASKLSNGGGLEQWEIFSITQWIL